MSGQPVPLSAQEAHGAAALAKVPEKLTTASNLANSVPIFTPMVRGQLQVEYAERGGRLIFHVYHTIRKSWVDAALQKAEQNPDDFTFLRNLDSKLAHDLEKMPWWPNTGEKLLQVFSDFFRSTVKVVFDPEVDSWSVTLPAPELVTAWSDQTRISLMNKLFASLMG